MTPPDKIIENPLAALPLEVLFQIISYLDVNDLNGLSRVDKFLLDISSRDVFWKRLLQLDFPEIYQTIYQKSSNAENLTAKEHYIAAYKQLTSLYPSLEQKIRKQAIKALILINRNNLMGLQEVVNEIPKDLVNSFLGFPYPFKEECDIPFPWGYHTMFHTNQNLLNTAINRGNLKVISLLVKYFNSETIEFLSLATDALKQAISIEHLDIIDLLLAENNSLLNNYDKNVTPFMFAEARKYYAMTIPLVKHGANLNSFELADYVVCLTTLAINNPNEKNRYQALAKETIEKCFDGNNLTCPFLIFRDILRHLIKGNFLEVICRVVNKGFNLGGGFSDIITTAIGNDNGAIVLLFLYHGVNPETAVPKEFHSLSNLIAQFPHFNQLWQTHGKSFGSEDRRIFATRRLEKINAILIDWIESIDKNVSEKPIASNHEFFKSEQLQFKILIQAKIHHWQGLQKISAELPATDELIVGLEELIDKTANEDIHLAWRLRFIKGKLELQKYNIEEPTMLPAAENEHSSQVAP